VDASAMPTMMIVEKAVDMILERPPLPRTEIAEGDRA